MPTLPIAAGWWAIGVTFVALVGSRLVLGALGDLEWPIIAYVALSVLLAYGPMVAFCVWASRRWGTGSLAADAGLTVKWIDLAWGPVVWLAALAGEISVAIVVLATRIPIKSNTEGIDDLSGQRGVIVALLISAVIAAPFVEELVFRGILLRSLASRIPIWWAVVLQGVIFGAAHADPSRGMGNIGLVLILSAVGIVLGGAAYLLRRIGPTIIAHMIFNGVVLLIVLFVHT
jgi:CAAX protease family protein